MAQRWSEYRKVSAAISIEIILHGDIGGFAPLLNNRK